MGNVEDVINLKLNVDININLNKFNISYFLVNLIF